MGKVLPFKAPEHDCYERQTMRSAGIVKSPCVVCQGKATRKRVAVAQSRARGNTVRLEKGWKEAKP